LRGLTIFVYVAYIPRLLIIISIKVTTYFKCIEVRNIVEVSSFCSFYSIWIP